MQGTTVRELGALSCADGWAGVASVSCDGTGAENNETAVGVFRFSGCTERKAAQGGGACFASGVDYEGACRTNGLSFRALCSTQFYQSAARP